MRGLELVFTRFVRHIHGYLFGRLFGINSFCLLRCCHINATNQQRLCCQCNEVPFVTYVEVPVRQLTVSWTVGQVRFSSFGTRN